jgi:ferric-dicitrate binding protein FerR (iron transport regulator)
MPETEAPSAFEISALLKELQQTPPSLQPAEARALAERHIPYLARQITEAPRKTKARPLHPAALATALAAAGALLWLALGSDAPSPDPGVRVASVEGRVEATGKAVTQRLTLDRELTAGDSLVLAPGARLALHVGQRFDLALSEQAQVRLEQLSAAADVVRLRTGRAHFSVTKRDGPLTVTSPHLKVMVTGTRFFVIATLERSCVSVEEGAVVVTYIDKSRTLHLGAGQALSSDGIACNGMKQPLVRPKGPDSARPDLLRLDELPAVPNMTDRGQGQSAISPSSTLAEQNVLLERAISARRQARFAEARAILGDLLRRFPETPLRPAAEEELKRMNEVDKNSP